ncbi:MAG: hypothetical protein J0M05_07915 [Candidatus Kapabacteria bacterium]|jgi:hypothetical protein|nr:hypothetical protein [Candidatus Kapabacteria bacterium]
MKSLKIDGVEIFLLQESLKHYKSLVEKEEFSKNSFITKEYVIGMISQLEEKLKEIAVKDKVRSINATT